MNYDIGPEGTCWLQLDLLTHDFISEIAGT